jgi:hypothetical protein
MTNEESFSGRVVSLDGASFQLLCHDGRIIDARAVPARQIDGIQDGDTVIISGNWAGSIGGSVLPSFTAREITKK